MRLVFLSCGHPLFSHCAHFLQALTEEMHRSRPSPACAVRAEFPAMIEIISRLQEIVTSFFPRSRSPAVCGTEYPFFVHFPHCLPIHVFPWHRGAISFAISRGMCYLYNIVPFILWFRMRGRASARAGDSCSGGKDRSGAFAWFGANAIFSRHHG